jgi:hypothetical protein
MKNIHKINNNIYITSDEEIKMDDWYLDDTNSVRQAITECESYWTHRKKYQKIILTTDEDLIKDGIQPIDEEFLEWFVKNPSCEFVEIIPSEFLADKVIYEINIPQEEPKQETTLEEAAKIDLSKLCYYDKRNPDYIPYNEDDLTEIPKDCYCDNCFYGRSKLTEQLIMQAERMYSEEDMEKAFYEGLRKAYSSKKHNTCWKEWFEQFKKK